MDLVKISSSTYGLTGFIQLYICKHQRGMVWHFTYARQKKNYRLLQMKDKVADWIHRVRVRNMLKHYTDNHIGRKYSLAFFRGNNVISDSLIFGNESAVSLEVLSRTCENFEISLKIFA